MKGRERSIVISEELNLEEMYRTTSMRDIAKKIGVSVSTTRRRMIEMGIKLRNLKDALQIAKPKMGSGWRGKKRPPMSEETKRKIAAARTKPGERFRLKTSGYLESTRGETSGKSQHRLIIERAIGRELMSHECVHHKDHNRANNSIENLELMSRSEHSRLHACERKKIRDEKTGRFKGGVSLTV